MSTVTNFSSRQAPWMIVGESIDAAIPSEEAMRKAGLDFDVELRQVRYQDTTKKKSLAFKGRQVVARVDTDEPFGIVSDDYEIVQYREAFDFIDGVNPLIVAAGQLKKGRHAFMVVKTENSHLELFDGDPHDLFTVLRTSHDGSKAVEVFIMPLRDKCMNQLPLRSFSKNASQHWSFRHVEGVREKMAQAQAVVAGVDLYGEEFAKIAKRLADIDVNVEETEELLKTMLPDRPRREQVIESISGLAQSSSTLEGFHGTGWGVVNAVGEYYDHIRNGGSAESHLTNALSGVTNKYVNRTAQLLLRR